MSKGVGIKDREQVSYSEWWVAERLLLVSDGRCKCGQECANVDRSVPTWGGVVVVRKPQEEAHCARSLPCGSPASTGVCSGTLSGSLKPQTGPGPIDTVFSYTYLPMMKSIN